MNYCRVVGVPGTRYSEVADVLLCSYSSSTELRKIVLVNIIHTRALLHVHGVIDGAGYWRAIYCQYQYTGNSTCTG